MSCPFKVRDKLKNKYTSDVVRVTGITSRGFEWKAIGHTFFGKEFEGESFKNRFDHYEKI